MFSPTILILGFFLLQHINFSSADGFSADELLSFNTEDVAPLQDTMSTSLLDPTIPNSVPISDTDFGNDNAYPDVFNILGSNDPNLNSDLFASDADLTTDPTIFYIADCGSINNSVLRKNKKARVRRETACHNPDFSSDPNLSLPTLDQARKDPLRPKTEREKKLADITNAVTIRTGSFLKATTLILARCYGQEERVCSSGSLSDVQFEGNGGTYVVKGSTTSKRLPLSDT